MSATTSAAPRMRPAIALAAALGALGCTKAPVAAAPDLAANAPDLSLPGLNINLSTKVASELQVDLVSDGGAVAPLTLRFVWVAVQDQLTVYGTWMLCDLPIPGLVDVPVDVLGNYVAMSNDGALDGTGDGAHFTQPAVVEVVGARLADPATDPLPKDASKVCAGDSDTGCVIAGAAADGGMGLPSDGLPGVPVDVKGMWPGVATINLDLRVSFAFDATVTLAGRLDGAVTSAAVEAHVLACRHDDQSACSPAEVARLEAAHAPLTLKPGRLRSHVQNFYFTCSQYLADPESALSGVEPPDGGVDGWVADLGASGDAK